MRKYLMTISLALALAGCGGAGYQMTGRGPAVGADAQLAVDESGAGNRRVELEVSHLPPPERLGEGFDAYHVWVAPAGGQPVLLGRLEYDRDSRSGHLNAVTPHDDFRLIVTPEPRGYTAYPSGVVVFEQYVGS